MLPLLRKRSRATVALDIGSNKVKCVRIDHSGEAPMLTHFAMVDLAPEAIVDGAIMDSQLVSETVRRLFDRCRLKKSMPVATALSGHSVIVKRISLPVMSEAELAESIRWEAEQYIPFDINDVNLDFDILEKVVSQSSGDETDKGDDSVDVMLVAAKKDVINAYVELLAAAGLNPGVLDVDVFALQNAASVAGLLMTTEAMIADRPPKGKSLVPAIIKIWS